MYINPFPFGIIIGVVGTLFIEIAILIAIAISKGDKE